MPLKKMACMLCSLLILLSMPSCGTEEPSQDSGGVHTPEPEDSVSGTIPSPGENQIVIQVGNTAIRENLYRYLLAEHKSAFLEALQAQDTEQFWESSLSGVSCAVYFQTNLNRMLSEKCAAAELYDASGLTLSEAERQQLAQALEKARQTENYASVLHNYSLSEDDLRFALELFRKYDALAEARYGKNGNADMSVQRYRQFYQENYVMIRHILIRTQDRELYDSDGRPIGTAALSELEQAEKKALADSLSQQLSAGSRFILAMREYSEDAYTAGYEDGFFVQKADAYPAALLTLAFSLEENTVGSVSDNGAVHFVERLPLPDDGFLDTRYGNYFSDFYSRAHTAFLKQDLQKTLESAFYGQTESDALNTPESGLGIFK